MININERILNAIADMKKSNINPHAIELGYNQLMELKNCIEFEIPEKAGHFGAIYGVNVVFIDKRDYFKMVSIND